MPAMDAKSKAPNFYENAASMSGPGAPGGPGGQPKPDAAASGEKVQNVKALLEVFKRMDKLEQDPDAKGMIQQMAQMAQQYMDKVQGGGKPAGAAPPPAPTSEGAAPGAEAAAGGGAPAPVPA